MIIVNFKNYKFGKESLRLVKQIEKYLPKAIICPATIDIESLSNNTKLKVFAQSADPYETDRATGFNTLSALKKAGATGVLINHSEHPLPISNIKKLLILSKKLKIKGIVCSPNIKSIKSLLKIKTKPYAIAFEDPKLISTGKSITQYNPESIKKFLKALKNKSIIPICGAGISTAEDVKQAYALGCKGVLIASAIAKSKNPFSLLKKIKEIER